MTDTATDARTAPVAVWQVLEKMTKEEREAWRVADIANRRPAAERNLDIGYPFGWYPFMLGRDLAVGEVKPARYFGRDLAAQVADQMLHQPIRPATAPQRSGCADTSSSRRVPGRPLANSVGPWPAIRG